MRDIPNKSNGDDYIPAEFNSFYDESKNTVVSSDQTLSEPDPYQLSKGISNYAGVGNFYVQTGSANVYILSPISPFKAPSKIFDGLTVRTRIVNTNTAASTLNWNGTGAKAIKKNHGADDIVSGDLVTGDYPIFVYELSGDIWNLVTEPIESNYPLGYLRGFAIEQDSGDTAHDIKFFAGSARSANDIIDMKIPVGSSIIKQTDANWAEGTNQGGFPNNITITPNTYYYCFAIGKPNGITDCGYDSGDDASNLLTDTNVIAAGYIDYIKVGTFRTDGSNNIKDFIMFLETAGGTRTFYWKVGVQGTVITTGGGDKFETLLVPPTTQAIIYFYWTNSADDEPANTKIWSPVRTKPEDDKEDYGSRVRFNIFTDDQSRISYNNDSTNHTNITVAFRTIGWIE